MLTELIQEQEAKVARLNEELKRERRKLRKLKAAAEA